MCDIVSQKARGIAAGPGVTSVTMRHCPLCANSSRIRLQRAQAREPDEQSGRQSGYRR
jgi:hypothetical protein